MFNYQRVYPEFFHCLIFSFEGQLLILSVCMFSCYGQTSEHPSQVLMVHAWSWANFPKPKCCGGKTGAGPSATATWCAVAGRSIGAVISRTDFPVTTRWFSWFLGDWFSCSQDILQDWGMVYQFIIWLPTMILAPRPFCPGSKVYRSQFRSPWTAIASGMKKTTNGAAEWVCLKISSHPKITMKIHRHFKVKYHIPILWGSDEKNPWRSDEFHPFPPFKYRYRYSIPSIYSNI